MCIMAVTDSIQNLEDATLRRMFARNPDGAGYCYAHAGLIHWSKGYDSADKWIKAIRKIPVTAPVLVHARIATHGGVSKGLTHPFPLCDSFDRMELTAGTLSRGHILAHNGILDFDGGKNHSDSEVLARILAPLSASGRIYDPDIAKTINVMIAGSRVAIMDTAGRVERYGEGWIYDCGVWYSNSGYSANYGSYYGCYTYDDWSDGDLAYPLPKGTIFIDRKRNEAKVAIGGEWLVDDWGQFYGDWRGVRYPVDYLELCDAACADCKVKCAHRVAECKGDATAPQTAKAN